MEREEIFSKFNIKDYNNILEKILEKKDFSEDTKNILLNILYKIENSYDDYAKVKVITKTKKEFLEEVLSIIEDCCNDIELVKPRINKQTILNDEKYIIDKKNKRIISYPNEKFIFYALYKLQKENFILDKKYDFLKEPIEELFNKGYIMDKQEIIRDFDGWSWNIIAEEIENYLYNLIYQNIKIIFGNDFLKKCINKTDFIEKVKNKLSDIENLELLEKIYKISVLEYIKNDELKQNKMKSIKESLLIELEKIENKKEYLQELASNKKEIGKEIKKIDELLNDNKMLRQKFINRNRELKEEERVFSLSEYTEILQDRRENYLLKLNEYSLLMKPMNYVKNKSNLKSKVEIISQIDLNNNYESQIYNLINELQLDFLNIINERIKKSKNKKELIEYIFLFRYYKLIKLNKEKQIKDIKEINKQLVNIEKFLLTKACKSKVINILCMDVQKNYEIVSKILDCNIIDLEDIVLEFNKTDNKLLVNVYDDNMIEKTLEFEKIEDLNVKLGKKIKLFN